MLPDSRPERRRGFARAACLVGGVLGLALLALVFSLGPTLVMDPTPAGPIGAGSVDEVLDLYRQAHRERRPELLHPAFLELAYLRWEIGKGRYDAALGDLFALELVAIRAAPVAPFEKMPGNTLPGLPEHDGLSYLQPRPNGTVGIQVLASDCQRKVFLQLRRRGGRVFEVDASIAVVRNDGRFFFQAARDILWEAAAAARDDRPPAFRAIPPGTPFRMTRELTDLHWEAAAQRVEALQRRADPDGNAQP